MMTSEKPTPGAWELYRRMFKDGDEVIIVTEDDSFEWGEVYAEDLECRIERPGVVRRLPWDEIVFMAHDGFPIKRIMGIDGKHLMKVLDTTDEQKVIRAALMASDRDYVPVERTYFGDPFLIENFNALLLNPGNVITTTKKFDNSDMWQWEEVFVLNHNNGAPGMLWDIRNLVEFTLR